MPFEPSFPVFSLWFCQNDSLRNRVNEIAPQLLSIETRHQWDATSFKEVLNLPFGSIVVLEVAKDLTVCGVPIGMEEDGLLHRILNDPNMPIVLCIGDLIAAQQVMDWLRLGVFSYVEREADNARLIDCLRSTANHAIEIQEHFMRYDRLRELWTSVSQREATVLDMILDGPKQDDCESFGSKPAYDRGQATKALPETRVSLFARGGENGLRVQAARKGISRDRRAGHPSFERDGFDAREESQQRESFVSI